MKNQYLISICIPSYNRPRELERLLNSIDSTETDKLQIIVCEDNSPKRSEISSVIEKFSLNNLYALKYFENEKNLGHGGNLRECIKRADGEFIIFMGDDDMFIPGKLDNYINFIKNNSESGYILRSSRQLLENGHFEDFKYYSTDKRFEPGIKAYTDMFLKSVFMSGFTIKRSLINNISESSLDETLLFQLYLLAEVCLNHPSAYCNTPFVQGIGDGVSYFGINEKEKGLYTPGKVVTNNLNFISGFLKITNFIDKKYKLNSTEIIKTEMSKYSYPLMSNERRLGRDKFLIHIKNLRNLGLDNTIYFNIYFLALLIFGDSFCKLIIRTTKRIIGRRINL